MAELPDLLARTYGARSCVLHWWHPDGEADIVSHNGYYPEAEMVNYAENFTDKDLWSIRGAKALNEVQNCDELVSPAEYERSEFYNDWIRGMGDDTFHCLGACVRTRWGTGFVGLHRGKSQGTFGPEREATLRRDIVDLRRMLAIRGRIARAQRNEQEARQVLDRLGDAFIIVSDDGRILSSNPAGERLLQRGDGVRSMSGRIVAAASAAQRPLATAIVRAADPSAPGASALSLPRPDGSSLDVTFVPLAGQQGRARVLITVRDPDAPTGSLMSRLKALYGLSRAEAESAVLLAEGLSPTEISERRGTTVGTVRNQVKVLAFKMGCSRQLEIAAIVNRLTRVD